VTGRAKITMLEVLPKGCGQHHQPRRSLSRLYLQICHRHRPPDLPPGMVMAIKTTMRAGHTRLQSEMLRDRFLSQGHNRLLLGGTRQTRRRSAGGTPFRLLSHMHLKTEEAIGAVQEKGPAVVVLGGNSRRRVHQCEGEGPKVEAPIGIGGEDRQMTINMSMTGINVAIEMADGLQSMIPGITRAPLARGA
jgi:hypothetical protein